MRTEAARNSGARRIAARTELSLEPGAMTSQGGQCAVWQARLAAHAGTSVFTGEISAM
jgi:hypothetical protein